jgi:acyl-CoA thioesterase I
MGRMPAQVRICVVGDALVAGVGDLKALGWVGRVAARTPQDELPVTMFPLGVPGETTADLAARWWDESRRRFGDGMAGRPGPGGAAAAGDAGEVACRLVLGLGHGDAVRGMSLPRSRLNLANVLDDAHSRGLPAFVVGPPPVGPPEERAALEELSATFGDVCRRRDVPFVDTFAPLVTHETWLTDLAAGDGIHPGQAGYGLIAWLVLHGGWYEWLGVPRP